MLNQQIQNYKILSPLGQGGMATVYLAYDSKFDTNVAIKLLNKEYTHNENIRKRFLAEAKSMFRMSHPNIIKVTDLIDDGSTVAFVMEYVDGETLKEYIERKIKLTDEEIKSIFAQMVEAVGYVHKQNLVHRDIKPSNFMVDPEGKVKLMDFGIAKNTDANSAEYTQTGTGMQMGTPMYMSPEQVKSTKEVTFASDIYSLGVVLWQMVMGEKPYDTKTLSTFELQLKIVQEELPQSNTHWDAIIGKATTKKIEERYQSCFIILNDIKFRDQEDIIKPSSKEYYTIKSPMIGTFYRSSSSTKPAFAQVGDVISKGQVVCIIEAMGLFIDIESEVSGKIVKVLVDDASLVEYDQPLFLIEIDSGLSKNNFLPNEQTVVENKKIVSDNVSNTADNFNSKMYFSVKIGNQIWMTENLNVSRFRNGDVMPEAKTDKEWQNAGDRGLPAWCYYENKTENGEKYGKLYNWYAVNDPRGLAPEGWHVPSDNEWSILINFLGGEDISEKKMKSSSGWDKISFFKSGNGTNESGFTGLPGGSRIYNGYFSSIGRVGDWWSSTEFNTSIAWNRLLYGSGGHAYRDANDKRIGLSVRCLRD